MLKKLNLQRFENLSNNNYSIFSCSKTGDFFQQAPELGNQYEQDPFLIELLSNCIPKQVRFFNTDKKI
jgi:hypothetical protein